MATCSSADSVLNAATQIKSNATKLNDFVNGTATQTVQLGASTDTPTPTLRKFVADAQSTVALAANDAAQTVLDTVAANETAVASLENDKADKVSGNVEDHIAALDMYGNLQDSRIDMDDVATISVDIANLDTDKADKVSNATSGHFAGLDASGNLTDSGRSPADITALEEAVESLEERKADKFIPAEPGNLAELTSTGNLRDAGRAVEDFVPLLAYAHDEALDLALLNRMNIEVYEEWYARGLAHLEAANIDAKKTAESIRKLIDAFDESYAQHRLQKRLFDGTNPTSSSKPMLFVICGQSNAAGAGEYTPFDSAVDCGQCWVSGQLKPIADPTGNWYAQRGSGWPAFARRFFALTGRKAILFNVACGGSAVTDGGYDTTNTWADNGYGTLRSRTQGIWNAFSAAVPASSYDMGAILWVQGEAEVGRLYDGTVTLSDYLGTWSNLSSGTRGVLQWLRNLIGEESCPVFIGRIGYSSAALTNPTSEQYYRMVIEAQEQLYDYETVFPGFSLAPRYLDAWNAYMKGTIHYSPLGYSIQGNAFARSVVSYLNF